WPRVRATSLTPPRAISASAAQPTPHPKTAKPAPLADGATNLSDALEATARSVRVAVIGMIMMLPPTGGGFPDRHDRPARTDRGRCRHHAWAATVAFACVITAWSRLRGGVPLES